MAQELQPVSLCIIGAGPNCVYALERLFVGLRERERTHAFDVHIFERTGVFGAGAIHDVHQPRSSVLNRIVGQISFAPDDSYVEAESLLEKKFRPTFYEWLQEKHAATNDERYNLDKEDWPPRYLHGEALMEQFDRYVSLLRSLENVQVHLHAEEVQSIREEESRYRIAGATASIVADHLLIATGFSKNSYGETDIVSQCERKAAGSSFYVVSHPYPLVNIAQERTGVGSSVACLGLGQSALDVILYLTEERGGVFEAHPDGEGLRYIPCGKEPKKIYGISRSGLLPCSRPFNAKEVDIAQFEHKGFYLTEQTIDRLRDTLGQKVSIPGYGEQRQIDFVKHVYPILVLEMELLYYGVLFGAGFQEKAIKSVRDRVEHFTSGSVAEHKDEALGVSYLLEPLRESVESTVQLLERFLSDFDKTALSDDEQQCIASYLKTVLESPETLPTSREAFEEAISDSLIYASDPRKNLFSWEELNEPVSPEEYTDGATYTEAMLQWARRDRAESQQDNLRNPTKCAIDGVWRDLRPILSYAIDYGGVTPESHRAFMVDFVRCHNRLADGGGISQNDKLIALIESGILDLRLGPRPEFDFESLPDKVRIHGPHTNETVEIDALINGRLSYFDIQTDTSPLVQSLLEEGLIQLWINPSTDSSGAYAPGGIVLTPELHPIDTNGNVRSSISFLGAPTEGATYFRFTLARPDQNHRVLNEVIAWSKRFFTHI